MIGTVLYNIIVMPLEMAVELIYSFLSRLGASPGIAVLGVSLAVNFLVLPLYQKSDALQEAEREKQKQMKPWLDHIKKTFRGDERFMMQQTYYRQQNYKPYYVLKGSVSLFLQIPFFIAAYHFLSNLADFEGARFLFLSDLSQPDGLIKLGSLSVNLMPLLMTAINIVSGMIYTRGFTVKEKLQLYGMALVFLVLLYASPSGLVLYWTMNNLFSLLKNVFLKLVKHPAQVLAALAGLAGAGLLVFMAVTGRLTSGKRIAVIGLAALLLQIPWIVMLLKKKNSAFAARLKAPSKPLPDALFFLGALTLTVLLGIVVPLSVISSSAVEFASTHYGPVWLVVYTASVYAGLFLLWFTIFWLLGDQRVKNFFTAALWVLSGVCLLDFMVFPGSYGRLSPTLVFDAMSPDPRRLVLLNLAVGAVLAAALLFVLRKWTKAVKPVYGLVLTGLAVLIVTNSVAVAQNLRVNHYEGPRQAHEQTLAGEYDKLLHFSKDGQNVIVIMLDRAIGAMLPHLLEADPSLKTSLDGFTFYPNTVSFGMHTLFSTPSMFGGYDYTPSRIDERADVPLREKHNEALKLLPALFGSAGSSVTVCDPPYANYAWTPDLSIYDDMPYVTARNLSGQYISEFLEDGFDEVYEEAQQHNFIYYSLMRCVPAGMRATVYDNGKYFKASQADVSKNVSMGFLEEYSTLRVLPWISDTEAAGSTFLLFQNGTPHEYTRLAGPDYEPSLRPVTDHPNFDDDTAQEAFDVNMASLRRMAAWFNWMRENGVWDNTRIILAGDHGYELNGALEEMNVRDEFDITLFNPLLLVKDFGAAGFTTDQTFMTLADIPSLALEGIVKDPVNPFTGNPVDQSLKAGPQRLPLSRNWNISDHGEFVFNYSGVPYVTVERDIFDHDSWNILYDEVKAP